MEQGKRQRGKSRCLLILDTWPCVAFLKVYIHMVRTVFVGGERSRY